MGLTMSQRQAVAKTIAARYKRASRVEKGTRLSRPSWNVGGGPDDRQAAITDSS